MISVNARRLFLCAQPVDMRKGMDGLASIVLTQLQQNPSGGDIFIFLGKRSTSLKALCWDGDGYWLCNKRLAEGRFLIPLVERSDVRLLIDHCGRPTAGQGVEQPGFQALLGLARTGRVAVKLSGYQKFSMLAPPYADTLPFLDALIEAFSLNACLWASDWPFLRAPQRLDLGPLLRGVERMLPDAADRRRLFWETPQRWLNF